MKPRLANSSAQTTIFTGYNKTRRLNLPRAYFTHEKDVIIISRKKLPKKTARGINKHLQSDIKNALPDFCHYGNSHFIRKRKRKGIENEQNTSESVPKYIEATSEKHRSLIDSRNEYHICPEVVEYIHRKQLLEKLLKLRYAWPHVGVHSDILDEFIRQPIYDKRQHNLNGALTDDELVALREQNVLLQRLPLQLQKTCGECLATFQDVINFKNRTIVKDGSIENLKLYENTGYKEVDERILQYASDYIEATDGMSIINGNNSASSSLEVNNSFYYNIKFRNMQKEIINCMFTGLKDVLVALPTSDGKTLPIVVSAMVKHFFNSDEIFE